MNAYDPRFVDDEEMRANLKATSLMIGRYLKPTPLISSPRTGENCWLKLETLHPTGSFKIRGAYSALSTIKPGHSFVTCSAGNHGLAMSHVAKQFGVHACIVISQHASKRKIELLRATADELILHRGTYDGAELYAKELANHRDVPFISPYNNIAVIMGQASLGVELLEQISGPFTVVSQVGGGGLASGIGLALVARKKCSIVCIEAENSAPMSVAFAKGKVLPIDIGDTKADGLAGNLERDTITFPILNKLCKTIITVTENEIQRAMQHLAHAHGLIVEAAGAVSVAAILSGKVTADSSEPLISLITGRNIDLTTWGEIVRSQECA